MIGEIFEHIKNGCIVIFMIYCLSGFIEMTHSKIWKSPVVECKK